MIYYINTVHGFVRDVRFVHNVTGASVFDATPDVRRAMQFSSFAEAEAFIVDRCKYRGHYCVMVAA